jgi:hypothetical protein
VTQRIHDGLGAGLGNPSRQEVGAKGGRAAQEVAAEGQSIGRGANECRKGRQCEEEGEGGQVLPAGRATGAAAALAEAAVCHTHMHVVNSGHSGGVHHQPVARE